MESVETMESVESVETCQRQVRGSEQRLVDRRSVPRPANLPQSVESDNHGKITLFSPINQEFYFANDSEPIFRAKRIFRGEVKY